LPGEDPNEEEPEGMDLEAGRSLLPFVQGPRALPPP
jgi:hypothetical protein